MRAVKYLYLALLVRGYVVRKDNVQPRLVCGQLLLDKRILLKYPEVEYLALYDVVVLKTNLLTYLRSRVARITGNYSVNESACEMVSLGEPLNKAHTHLVDTRKLKHYSFQFITVVVDKLAWDDSQPLAHIAVKMLITGTQQRKQFSGETLRTLCKVRVRGIKRDASLGGIGYNYLQVLALSIGKVLFIFLKRVDKVTEHIDNAAALNLFSLVDTLQADGVQPILFCKLGYSAHWHRLYHRNIGVYHSAVVKVL